MAGTYSRVVEASVTGGVSNCIELPVPPRGVLDRLDSLVLVFPLVYYAARIWPSG